MLLIGKSILLFHMIDTTTSDLSKIQDLDLNDVHILKIEFTSICKADNSF